jgi:hypothetical protein
LPSTLYTPSTARGLRCRSGRDDPPPDRVVQGVSVDTGQDPPERRLVRRPIHPGERIAEHAQLSKDLLRDVTGPFRDRRRGPGTGQHRRDGGGQDARQRMHDAAGVTPVRHARQRRQQTRPARSRQRFVQAIRVYGYYINQPMRGAEGCHSVRPTRSGA